MSAQASRPLHPSQCLSVCASLELAQVLKRQCPAYWPHKVTIENTNTFERVIIEHTFKSTFEMLDLVPLGVRNVN